MTHMRESIAAFWRRLPVRLRRAEQMLADASERGEVTNAALVEHVRVVESGLAQLGREIASAPATSCTAPGLRRVARVIELSIEVVMRGVALKCCSNTTALVDLELVAYELELVRQEAMAASKVVSARRMRGAA